MTRSQQSLKCDVWWQCPSPQCRGWEWARHAHCRKCGSNGPQWARKYTAKAAGGSDATEGFVQMPTGKKARKRALAKLHKQQAEKPTEGGQEDPKEHEQWAPMETAAQPGANPELLLAQLKKLEATQRLLGNDGPPAVLEELEQAMQSAREQLRERAP
eukprot:4573875-Amphidinium_carterae.1